MVSERNIALQSDYSECFLAEVNNTFLADLDNLCGRAYLIFKDGSIKNGVVGCAMYDPQLKFGKNSNSPQK